MKTWKQWAADASIDFWSPSEDVDNLMHETLDEAVESYIDDCLTSDDVEAQVRSLWPIGLTVYGWRRRDVSADWLSAEACRLAEVFSDDFEDEFGGGDRPSLDGVALANLELAFCEALKSAAGLIPWQCTQEVETTIPLEELLAELREHRSDLFEVTP